MCISLVIMFIFHSSFRILLNSYMPASSGRRLVHSSIGRGGLCGAGATRGHRPEGRGQESGAGGPVEGEGKFPVARRHTSLIARLSSGAL